MSANDIIKKYELENKTWTHKNIHGVLHFFFPVGEEPIKPLLKYFGDCHKITVFYFKDNIGEWYWNNEEMVRLRNKFIEKTNADPKLPYKLCNEWHKRIKKFNKIMKEIDKIDLSKLSDSKLLKLYYKWYNAYLEEYGIAIGIQDAFSMHADDFLMPHFKEIILNKGFEQKFNEYYTTLFSPIDESFITREYRDRLKLLCEIKKGKDINSKGIMKKLEKHAKKYHWTQNNYAKDVCLDAEYFKKQIIEITDKDPVKELKQLDNNLKEIKLKKQKIIKELKFDEKSNNLIKISEVFAYMQDERKKYVLIATHYESMFIDEFGKRLNLDRKHMEYTYIHELKELLEKKRNKQEISANIFEERRSSVIVIQTLKGYEVISGEIAEKVHKTIFDKEEKTMMEIKGTIASEGIAKGIVKIVKTTHNLINFNQNDILVASMTRPEMITAMKKAAAIVTDEGGITSHAAIISRELKIPCIIGTKIATKVLKDGDMVEVNANKGVVRKLR